MAEALVFARAGAPDDGATFAAWQYARGHVVDVKPDGWGWQEEEEPRQFATAAERKFALLRFPGISVARINKYLAGDSVIDVFTGRPSIRRGRLWQVLWTTLPLAARNILIATGVLTIGPTGDFTWDQVKAFIVRLDTGASDTEALV